MPHDVLGGEDAAWLHMEDETNPMVVNAVLQLAAPLPVERVRPLLERIAALPRFRARVVERRSHVGPPRWEPMTDFDVRQHIEQVVLESSDDAALRAFIGSAVGELLDRDRPLWRLLVIDRPSAGTTLLFRVHHAIADGFALLGVLLSVCDGDGEERPPMRAPPRRSRTALALASVRALGRIVALPPDPKTLLKTPLGRHKRVAWSRPLPLADVKRAAHLANATVNDVLVAMAAGALGRYLEGRGQREESLEVRAMVPVDLRGAERVTALGNRFGLVVLGLPVGVVDPVARLTAVKQRMDLLKGTPEAAVTHAVLRAMGWAPRAIEALGVRFFGTKTSLVLTNVPGPQTVLSLAGVPISRVIFWVPQAARMGLGVSILSYAGEVTIGVLADDRVIPDLGALMTALDLEVAALLAGISGGDERRASTQGAMADGRSVAAGGP